MGACSASFPQWDGRPGTPTVGAYSSLSQRSPDEGRQDLTTSPLGSRSKDTVDLLSPFSRRRNIPAYWFS